MHHGHLEQEISLLSLKKFCQISLDYGYKVLGNGKVTKKVTVQAAAFSQAAKDAIEAAGGKAEVI